MKFDVYGPFKLPRNDARLIDNSTSARNGFWELVDQTKKGVRKACGVYIYCVSAKTGTLPWYVGLTEKRSFDKRADRHAKLYDDALWVKSTGKIKVGVTPQLFLVALHTKSKSAFAKPSPNGHASIQFLETYLIGLALERNPNLLNIRDTKFLKSMYVPGFLNSRAGKPSTEAQKLKKAFRVKK